MDNEENGKIMKDESRSESQAEIWRGGPARHSCLVRRLVHRGFNEGGSRLGEGGCGEGGSKSVKVGQTNSPGQAGGQN